MAESTKTCKRCCVARPLSAFRLHNRGGPRGTCRDCENRAVREAKPWRSERKRQYMRLRRTMARGFALCNDARRRAKDGGLPFDLDPRDIQARVMRGFCEVTGLPFGLDRPKSWDAPSLDQIVPSAGYTRQNTRVVLYALNTMANTWGLEIVKLVASRLP